MEAMRKFNSWTFLGVAIYLVLLSFAARNIYDGPLRTTLGMFEKYEDINWETSRIVALLKIFIRSLGGATKLILDTVDLEPVLPTLSICRHPGFETNGWVHKELSRKRNFYFTTTTQTGPRISGRAYFFLKVA